MPSALALQLAASASANASLLSKKRPAESYLFTAADADAHDLDAIHALAASAFNQLCALSPAFSSNSTKVDSEQSLFSDAARAVDRTLQTADLNTHLDRHIDAFLALLGPWLMEAPTTKVLEWLVRRFRINEFNVSAVLALFLPYHESPHFVKMLSILHIQQHSDFSFLLPFKAAAKPLARSALIKAMISDTQVARFVADLLPSAVKSSHSHRTLVAFHTATMHDYISAAPSLDDGILAFILPSLLTPLQSSQKDANVVLGGFVLLCTLAQKVNLKPAAVSAIINAMSSQVRGARGSGKGSVSTVHFVKAAVAICSSQETVFDFPPSARQLCIKMSGFADELSKIMAVVDSQRFILPLLQSFSQRIHEHRVSALFSTLINTPNAPLAIIKELARILIRIATLQPDGNSKVDQAETKEQTASVARSLLSLIHQRHLELLKDVADDVLFEISVEKSTDKKDRKRIADELLMTFSLDRPLAESSDVNEVVVASASTSKDARAAAVIRLYSMLKITQNSLSAQDKASIRSALLGRIYDTDIGVLQPLYTFPDLFLSTMTPATSPQELLDIVTAQLLPTPPARAILRAHAAFLTGPFCKRHPEFSSLVQQTAFFPLLLATKAKLKTTRGIWGAIRQGGGFQAGWLRGAVEVWEQASCGWEGDKDDGDIGLDKLCDVNLGIAEKIAENILAASDSTQEIDSLLAKLHDPILHACALAYLVCRALMMRASGAQQISLAHRTVRAMRLTSLEMGDDVTLEEASDARYAAMKVVAKAGRRKVIHALQASILVIILALPTPSKLSAVCVSLIPPSEQISSDPDQCYISLMQEIYALASASAGALPNRLPTSVLQALFLNLGDSSLAFLIGALLSFSPALENVRTHVLLHVLAFLRGHSETSAIDFQTVLPSLIAILLDTRSDKRKRALVLECISLLCSTSQKERVYGLDTLYGRASARLQCADIHELSGYANALVYHREQLIQDADYIQEFHQRHFASSIPRYRRRVLCFLLSHVITHPFPFVRVALLRSIQNVTGFSKSPMLLSIMKKLTQDPASIAQTFGTLFESYVSLVVAGFLDMRPADLGDSACWSTFIAGLRFYFHSNSDSSARGLYANALEKTLFARLSFERQTEVCTILLQAGTEGGEVYLASRTLLGKLFDDVQLIVRLLVQFRPDQVEGEAPTNKRAKLDSAPRTNEISKLQPLSLLAEVLGTTEIPGSLDLISNLLETLNKIVRSDVWGPSDTSYVCQMLMVAIEKSASKLTDLPARSIRLDVLVELVRVTDNPQTFNEALLLIANLARLTPDSVLHNIMPIFTFMGSNIFHRDDSYSFKVVQNTIDSIVPVMASSLKTKHLDGLDLYIGARDFLRIFTDASNHIPRHRRQNFFVHLTGVLGAHVFLAPVCMLLVDKVTNRASRQSPEDAQNTLSLPTSLLRHFDRPHQLSVLTEVLNECLRLRSQLLQNDSAGLAFLDYPRDGEHSSSTSSSLKRRIQALILFASTALTPSKDASSGEEIGSTTDIISRLLDLAALPADQISEDDGAAIVTAAQTALGRIMSVISAREFLSSACVMLASDDTIIKTGALNVLTTRIPLITEELREECQETIGELVGLVRVIVERQSAGSLVEAALATLKSLGSSCCDGEETALMTTLPHVLKVVRSRTSAAAAMSVLPCYVSALGPRMIPHFRDVVQECSAILREGLKGKTQTTDVGEFALETLQSLLVSLPAFYGTKELTEVAKLYIDYSATSNMQQNPLSGLGRAISKRASAEVLLPVLYDLWPSLDKSQAKDVHGMIGYFTLLKRSLHAAPRAEVLDNVRPLFKMFMEAFDVGMTFGSSRSEPHAISAFIELVVKLNENAFRPLLRRMHDWAFADEKATDERMVTFCHVYTALLDYFKGLMNPYMSMLLRPLTEVLESFSTSSGSAPTNNELWTGVITTLTKSLQADDGAFWREDKLVSLLQHVLSQIPIAVRLASPSEPPDSTSADSTTETPPRQLTCCLLAAVAVLPNASTDVLKRLNLDLLMHTRSEDARVRMLALECATEAWKADGGKFIGFVGETATFVAECAEDENDNVVREAHRLKNAVESVAGSINGL